MHFTMAYASTQTLLFPLKNSVHFEKTLSHSRNSYAPLE